MKATGKLVKIAFASVSLVGGSVFLAATPADAEPQDCSVMRGVYTPEYSGGYATSYCVWGTGSHRVRVSCDRRQTSDVIRYGPWVPAGSSSDVDCASYETPRAAWVQTRG
jgi:hypothetical protein